MPIPIRHNRYSPDLAESKAHKFVGSQLHSRNAVPETPSEIFLIATLLSIFRH